MPRVLGHLKVGLPRWSGHFVVLAPRRGRVPRTPGARGQSPCLRSEPLPSDSAEGTQAKKMLHGGTLCLKDTLWSRLSNYGKISTKTEILGIILNNFCKWFSRGIFLKTHVLRWPVGFVAQ